MDIPQANMIIIEREAPTRYFFYSGSVPNYIGRPGINGEIVCGKISDDGIWEQIVDMSKYYPGVEIRTVPEGKGSNPTTYIYIPQISYEPHNVDVYIGLVQGITESTVAFTPLITYEGAKLESMKTYYFRSIRETNH